jgi:hypothetical protein
MKEDLVRRAEELGKRLPTNPLDLLIDKLGPDNVAEACPFTTYFFFFIRSK